MFWPGMGDPAKRRQTIRFLIITAIIGISVAAASSLVQQWANLDNPLKVCINDMDTPYTVTATLELYVDGNRADVPEGIGFEEGGCQRSLYTLGGDGVIHAAWSEEYPFEIGHFLWTWDFPLRDMVEDKSRIIVDGTAAPEFIRAPLVDGSHYIAEFTSKSYDDSKDQDFLPPDL